MRLRTAVGAVSLGLAAAAFLAILGLSGPKTAALPSSGAASSPVGPARTGSCATIRLSSTSENIKAWGTFGAFLVHADEGCPWTLTSSQSWLNLRTPSGTGPSAVAYTVDASTSPEIFGVRLAEVKVNGSVIGELIVLQAAPNYPSPCFLTVEQPYHEVPFTAGGGTSAIAVNESAGCGWSVATTGEQWIHVSADPNPSGRGTFAIQADANTTSAVRYGQVQVQESPSQTHGLDITLLVVQDGCAGCVQRLSRESINVSSDEQDVDLDVAADPDCSWESRSNASWVQPAATGGATGPGSIRLHVLGNAGTTRTGDVCIGGQHFAIRQAGAGQCYDRFLDPHLGVPADGGQVAVDVLAGPGCPWTVEWFGALGLWLDWGARPYASGSGPGSATFLVRPNVGSSARRSTMELIDDSSGRHPTADNLEIVQEGGSTLCCPRLQSSLALSAGPQYVSVPVAIGQNCRWVVEASASWLRDDVASAHIGPGSFRLQIDRNAGGPRQGTLTLYSLDDPDRTSCPQVVTVAQEGIDTCQYSVVPEEITEFAPYDRSWNLNLRVNTAPGCPWTVSPASQSVVVFDSVRRSSTTCSYSTLARPDDSLCPSCGPGSVDLLVSQDHALDEACVWPIHIGLPDNFATMTFTQLPAPCENSTCSLEELFCSFVCLLTPGQPCSDATSKRTAEPSLLRKAERALEIPFDLLRFRRVRDEILARSPRGRRYIDLYNAHTAEVVGLLASDPGLRDKALAAVQSWQGPLAELLDGRGATAFFGAGQASTMNALLDDLTRLGSPSLRADIAAERAALDLSSWVGRPVSSALARFEQPTCPNPDSTLCLQGGRFRATVAWHDFSGNSGVGHAVPLSSDTGSFWFFSPNNVELVVKTLDGRALNGNWWVFSGALSNVEYTLTVTDTASGAVRTYTNPSGTFASQGDTAAFPAGPPFTPPAATPAPPSSDSLLLNGERFRFEVSWRDFSGNTGIGHASRLTPDSGTFWFFNPENVELIVKALDGTQINGKWWVFYGALSNVEYTMTVTDTLTGAVRTYVNPSGRFASTGDTAGF